MYCEKCGHHKVDHGEKKCHYVTLNSMGRYETCQCKCSWRDVYAQQNAHLTPETLATSQAVVNASVLEQSDSDTTPAQAQVA